MDFLTQSPNMADSLLKRIYQKRTSFSDHCDSDLFAFSKNENLSSTKSHKVFGLEKYKYQTWKIYKYFGVKDLAL